MVTFNAAGRMGNFLFECATALAYSIKYNLDFTIPFETTNKFHSPLYLLHLQNKNYNPHLGRIDIWESTHAYEQLPFKEDWRKYNIIIQGYRQSEKYFSDYRKEIIEKFAYPYRFLEGYVSVHVRRTDYLALKEKHPEVTKEWYELAMSKFPNKKFVFYSDDLEYCHKTFGHRNDTYFSDDATIEEDLYEGSWMEHNICSASTFSWWQMWLNQNPSKIVYFPDKWFCDGWGGLETKDILPDWVNKLALT